MANRRLQRVGALLKTEISASIQEGLAGPFEAIISVTEVEVAADLRTARVYVSLYGGKAEQEKSFKRLSNAKDLFKRELFKKIRLRHIPELNFIKDRSLEKGSRISALLEKLKEERKSDERNNQDSPSP